MSDRRKVPKLTLCGDEWQDPYVEVNQARNLGPIPQPTENWRAGPEGSVISDVRFEAPPAPHRDLRKPDPPESPGIAAAMKHVTRRPMPRVIIEDHEDPHVRRALVLEGVPKSAHPGMGTILMRLAYWEHQLWGAYFGERSFCFQPALGKYVGRARTVPRLRQMIRDIRKAGR